MRSLLIRPLALGSLVVTQCVFLLTAPPLSGQAIEGTIQGAARSEEVGGPISFAFVRLLPVNGDTATIRKVVTGDAGHFSFARVPAADYRLELLRIGYRPVVSSVLRVKQGETLQHEFRVASQRFQLPTVTVVAAGKCVGPADVAADSPLGEIWNEARKGVDIRRAFELQYRFARTFRQNAVLRLRVGGARPNVRVDTLLHEPDSVTVRERRRLAGFAREGYARGNLLTLPDERQLFDDQFLRDHCLDPAIRKVDGVLGLAFRPARPERGRIRIEGTIWVDSTSYLMRRLDVEWLDGNRRIGDAVVDYTDMPVGGSALRLPVGGRAALYRITGPMSLAVRSASATFTHEYHDFARVQ
ncbi:MAG: carboxypeptidase-like regulatory domain-containing protein [Gemmatimonadaceae bacterium]